MKIDTLISSSRSVALPRMLDYLPIGLFGSVLGLLALGAAWGLAHALFGAPVWIGAAIDALALFDFVALALCFAIKGATAFDAMKAEFHHPVAGTLFGLPLICLLLVPIDLAPLSLAVARTMWIVGAIGTAVFAWLILSRWIGTQQQLLFVTPAWAIPAVGLIEIPLAVPSLHLPPMQGLMIACLSLGLFFIVPIFTMIFSRLIFEPPLPDALKPTILLLAAPFAIASSAYIVTTGHNDFFAESAFVIALFLLAVLLGRLRHLARCCPFRISWWAIGFPFASASVATLRYALDQPSPPATILAGLILAMATAIIAALLVRTFAGIVRGELRQLTS